jgi:hypothetical protein
VTRGGIDGCETEVIDDEQLSAAEAAREPCIATIAPCQCQLGEEFGDALIQHGIIVAAGLVTEGAGYPTLADSCG